MIAFKVDYAWDDLSRPQAITLTVFASRSCTYDLRHLGAQQALTYDNHFFITAPATFDSAYLRFMPTLPLLLIVETM